MVSGGVGEGEGDGEGGEVGDGEDGREGDGDGEREVGGTGGREGDGEGERVEGREGIVEGVATFGRVVGSVGVAVGNRVVNKTCVVCSSTKVSVRSRLTEGGIVKVSNVLRSGGSNVVDSGMITIVSVGEGMEGKGDVNTSAKEDVMSALEISSVCRATVDVGIIGNEGETARDGEGGIKMVVGSGNTTSSLEDGIGVGLVNKSLEAAEEVVGVTNTTELVSGKISIIDDMSTSKEVGNIVIGADVGVDEGSGNMFTDVKEKEGDGDGV